MRPTEKLSTASLSPRNVLSRLWQGNSGLAATELALLAPVLVLLMIAMTDYGLAWTRQMALANAVRAGTQYAMIRRPVQGNTAGIHQRVVDAAPADLGGTPAVTFFCECPDGQAVADCSANACGAGIDLRHYVTVTLQEDYPLILNYPGIGNPVSLENSATIRLN
jgi:Flp pilus assembly protein TadG